MAELRLINDEVRLTRLIPRPYVEVAEDEDILRVGVEWCPQGLAILGIELAQQVRPEVAARLRQRRWIDG